MPIAKIDSLKVVARRSSSRAAAPRMFRDRPLTWLFVIATVCLDLLWLAAFSADDSHPRSNIPEQSLLGFVGLGSFLAQSTALAVGATFARGPKFIRANVVVVGNALIAFFSFVGMGREAKAWLAFFTLHASVSLAVAISLRLIQFFRNRKRASDVWQTSLIELFGWTILVAILSFGFRFTDFHGLDVHRSLLMLTPSVALCLAASWGLSRKSRWPVSVRVASPFIVAFTVIIFFEVQSMGLPTDDVVGFYSAFGLYLCLWIIVQRMDSSTPQSKPEMVHTSN